MRAWLDAPPPPPPPPRCPRPRPRPGCRAARWRAGGGQSGCTLQSGGRLAARTAARARAASEAAGPQLQRGPGEGGGGRRQRLQGGPQESCTPAARQLYVDDDARGGQTQAPILHTADEGAATAVDAEAGAGWMRYSVGRDGPPCSSLLRSHSACGREAGGKVRGTWAAHGSLCGGSRGRRAAVDAPARSHRLTIVGALGLHAKNLPEKLLHVALPARGHGTSASSGMKRRWWRRRDTSIQHCAGPALDIRRCVGLCSRISGTHAAQERT